MFITIDADKILNDLRLPYYTIAMLRDMKLGDDYQLFDVYGPSIAGADPANASASIEKIKGGYSLSAMWMLNIGNARRRGHMWVPTVTINLLPGRKFKIKQANLNALRLFIRICRLAHRLAKMADSAKAYDDARKLRPSMLKRTEGRCGYEVEFLKELA